VWGLEEEIHVSAELVEGEAAARAVAWTAA
jgi:hypothetical protein